MCKIFLPEIFSPICPKKFPINDGFLYICKNSNPMSDYKPRIADALLKRKLAGKGAVLIQGPKWCGKTTTAEQIAASVIYLDAPDQLREVKIKADINPQELLAGATPRLLDEWQIVPQLWDAIRYEADHRKGFGHFILTGSSVPLQQEEEEVIKHTGTGRFGRLNMRPMSLFESGESTGEVSLAQLFDEPSAIFGHSNINLSELAFLTCRGGWPSAVEMDREIALDQAYDYCEAVREKDMSRVDGIKRNPEKVGLLMRSYARNLATQASLETIAADMQANEPKKMDTDTVSSYISALAKLFVVEESKAWNPNLRSKTAIRTSNTRYYTDPSIGTASLSIGPKDLENDLNTFGYFFETLAIRDLRTYAEALMGEVAHYRDADKLECDAVVHLRDGRYGLIEIKLGGEALIMEGVKSLTALKNKLDTTKMNKPSFLMVLTGVGSIAYRRPEDGIYVVPIGCLKP